MFVALALLAACNASSLPSNDGGAGDAAFVVPANLALPRGGKRLKATWFVTADGQPSFAGWHDAYYDVDCCWARQLMGT
jgi:hypothetical protein